MSFVIGFATPDFAIIASDGRSTYQDGSVASEYYNKTKQINENVIVGFAGETALCESVLSSFEESFLWTVETASSQVKQRLNLLNLQAPRKCSFIIAGINSKGEIELDATGISSGLQITRQKPTAQDFVYATLSPDNIDGDQIFVKNFNSKSWESIEEPFTSSIFEVAMLDSSVNTNCFFQKISLQKY